MGRAAGGWPRGGESLAVTSGDKAPYGDGEVRQRPGLDEGVSSCTRPGGSYLQLLPLTGAYIQRWCESGGAAAGGGEALAVPTLGMERAAARGPGSTGKHAVLGLRRRAGGGGERARVTLPCLENINLHVKGRAGPIPATGLPGHGDGITKLYKMGAGRVPGPGAASAGRHGARWGGRWRVRSPGDVEICLKTRRLFVVFFFPRNETAVLRRSGFGASSLDGGGGAGPVGCVGWRCQCGRGRGGQPARPRCGRCGPERCVATGGR